MGSLFGALTVAVNGLNAQSQAIGNISDNLANTQTIGYKRVDTGFESLVTQSNLNVNDPGGVKATPIYQNSLQGGLQQSSSSTSLSISGDGFFAVKRAAASATGGTDFQNTDYFTRRGDFTLNRDGYLVNGSGYYLLGYKVDSATGASDTSATTPIQISAVLDNPVATSEVKYAANLPAGAEVNKQYPTSSILVYDALGNTHSLGVTWTKLPGTNQWQLGVTMPDTTIPVSRKLNFEFSGTQAGTLGSSNQTVSHDATQITNVTASNSPATLTLGSGSWDALGYKVGSTVTVAGATTSANNVTYTISNITNGVATVSPAPTTAAADAGVTITRPAPGISASSVSGQTGSALTIIPPVAPSTAASISFVAEFPGSGQQTVTLNLGDYNKATGLTQYADTDLQTTSFEQNGIPRGSFQDLAIDNNGYVTLNYDNGRSRTLYQVPLVQFNSPNSLQRIDGGAFSRTIESGTPRYSAPNSVGAGSITGNSLEGSNVDIAEEFTKMIQSQRVYSANSKTITTTNSMLEEVINVIR